MSLYFKNFYSSFEQYSNTSQAFDEGPLLKINAVGINSSSINTDAFDAFRQGVEITLDKHARNGLYKISAGTPGHIVRPTCYGVNEINIVSEYSYVDVDPIDPATYLTVSSSAARDRMIGSEDDLLKRSVLYNGIIEPLTIRTLEGFLSNEAPYTMRDVHGALMEGNTDRGSLVSDQILTVDYVPFKLVAVNGSRGYVPGNVAFENKAWFLDSLHASAVAPGSGSLSGSIRKQLPQNGSVKYFLTDISGSNRGLNVVGPFNDVETYLRDFGITTARSGADMVAVFNTMTGSTGNYVPPGKKSATTGLIYDNIGYSGTDSIAFGGMTY